MALKVLFADDSMTAQNMGKRILGDAGYQVVTVSNGAAAVKKLAEKPDIIILDVFMPGYSGLEVCEKIRNSQDMAKTPVILTVGKMEPYKPEDGAKVKADGVVIKPFEASDLLAVVQKLAEQHTSAKLMDEEKTIGMPAAVEASADQQEEVVTRAKTEVAIPEELSAAPAFGFESFGEPSGALSLPDSEATPGSYGSIHEEPQAVDFDAARARQASIPAAKRFDLEETQPITPYREPMGTLESFEPRAGSGPVPPDPIVEFTAAPAVDEIQMSQEASLEPTILQQQIEVMEAKDPALLSDPTETASEVTTKFGVGTAGQIVAGSAMHVPGVYPDSHEESRPVVTGWSAAEEEFEAKVAKAMAAFETPAESSAEASAELLSEAPPAWESVPVQPEANLEVEASGYHPAPPASAPVSLDDTQPIEVENFDEPTLPPPAAQEYRITGAASPEERQMSRFEYTPEPTHAVPEPMIEQPSATVEVESAKAVAAAVGVEGAAISAQRGADSETVSRIVSKIMERFMPELVASIARELEAERTKK